MNSDILNLEPKRLWHYFHQICQCPHGSGNEKPLRDYIIRLTDELSLTYEHDATGNIFLRKSASHGLENAKPIALQGHLDMVCVSNDSTHDFLKDPIRPKIKDEWVTAETTTLGADGGIGLAACLALMEDNKISHGPIECLFTVSEEMGLGGAFGLKTGVLKSKTLINLDSEDEGIFYIGCAGACVTTVNFPVKKEPLPNEYVGMVITISGLKGGHSGLVIHEQRGNAIKILSRILYNVHRKYDILLGGINGGQRRNAIASTASAVIAIKNHEKGRIAQLLDELREAVADELRLIDPGFELAFRGMDIDGSFGEKTTSKVLSYLYTALHGVITMSYDILGHVQTSTNLGLLKSNDSNIFIQYHSRSSCESELEEVKSKLNAHAELLGVRVEESDQYPAWQPDTDSNILRLMSKIYKELYGVEPQHTAVHGGLETGVIGSKYPGIDMVSIGPTIREAHSINEMVHVGSVQKFWQLLVKTIEAFARQG